MDRDAMLDLLKFHLLCAQQKMKAVADSKQREVQFEVGDLFYLKLRPYRKCRWHGVAIRFYGPYAVTHRVGPMAYRLALPMDAAIHPVFHVSQLRRAVGRD